MNKHELEQAVDVNPFAVLSDVIYQRLYEEIISLRIPPGARLNETRLAEELGVSRTPVKKALARLAEDNLLNKKGGNISVVSPMAKTESRHLYEARIAVEGYAAYLAVDRISQPQLARLEQLADQYEVIGRRLDPATYAECDHNFHAVIIEAAQSEYIGRMYRGIESRLRHYRHCLLFSLGADRLQPILAQAARRHQTVLNAIKLGFADMARAEIERDIGGMTDVFSQWP